MSNDIRFFFIAEVESLGDLPRNDYLSHTCDNMVRLRLVTPSNERKSKIIDDTIAE